MPSSSSIDPFARHLAFLFSVVDLAARFHPDQKAEGAMADVLLVIRLALRADRVSLFQIENADYDENTTLLVTRIGRNVEATDNVVPIASFQATHVALLLAPLQTGAMEAIGPLRGTEPFYSEHRLQEPSITKFAALAPVLVHGESVGVLEVARASEEPFEDHALTALEAAARAVAAAVFQCRREYTIRALFAELLPELFDSSRAPTSLPARLRQWLATRRTAPAEREALALAITIAELSQGSSSFLELAHTVLSAMRKTMAQTARPWSAVEREVR